MSMGGADFGRGVVRILKFGAFLTNRRGRPGIVHVPGLLELTRGRLLRRPSPGLRQVTTRLRTDPGWLPEPFPASGAAPVTGTGPVPELLRELRWKELTSATFAAQDLRWHAAVPPALRAALAEATAAGVEHAGPIHLLAGLLRDPAGALTGLRVDRDELCELLRADPAWRTSDEPYAPLIRHLGVTMELDRPGGGWFARRAERKRQPDAISADGFGGALTVVLLRKSMRRAIRGGDGPVTSARLLVAAVTMRAQLLATGNRIRPALVPHNGAPDVLHAHGVTVDRAVAALPADAGGELRPDARFPGLIQMPWPAWTAEAAADRAVDLARAARGAQVGSSHLTIAALEPAGGSAARLLRTLAVDPDTVRTEVAAAL
ncbi:Clp protease N-terminal domain-containing protein [Dactylosporangium cerinum]|uniref:Clp protease N-terminal domain-containing protein n=1 Tax=Dactylosporangium cerinum TaxID=1434730 RepID=A0ABV9WCJ8_9ACTN